MAEALNKRAAGRGWQAFARTPSGTVTIHLWARGMERATEEAKELAAGIDGVQGFRVGHACCQSDYYLLGPDGFERVGRDRYYES